MKNFMRSSSNKIVIVMLSKSKSSAFSLVGTKQDGSDEKGVKQKIEYEKLSKKLVLFFFLSVD